MQQALEVKKSLLGMSAKIKGFLENADWVLDKGATPAPTKTPDIFRLPPEQVAGLMHCDNDLSRCNACIACRQSSKITDGAHWAWRCEQVRRFCCHSIIRDGMACYDCAKHALAILKLPVLDEGGKAGCEVLPKYV
jgi:hypothetical protein